ncbi:hypothetical protein Acal02_03014 [Acinetobacter calcoaceticus]|nr:hypothetical protein F987_02042 [Acinetobacter gyllenbergii NIPH 230]
MSSSQILIIRAITKNYSGKSFSVVEYLKNSAH